MQTSLLKQCSVPGVLLLALASGQAKMAWGQTSPPQMVESPTQMTMVQDGTALVRLPSGAPSMQYQHINFSPITAPGATAQGVTNGNGAPAGPLGPAVQGPASADATAAQPAVQPAVGDQGKHAKSDGKSVEHAVSKMPKHLQSKRTSRDIRLANHQPAPPPGPNARDIDQMGRMAQPNEEEQEPVIRNRQTDITATPETRAKLDSLIRTIDDVEATLNIYLRRSRIIITREPISRVSIADPGIIEFVQYSPREIEVIGLETGETSLTIWFGEQQQREMVRYLVRVAPDPGEQTEREIEYGELQDRVNEFFPNSFIQLIPIADKLIVRGQARDPEEATQIMSVIRGEAVNQTGQLVGPGGYGGGINPWGGGGWGGFGGGLLNQGPAARLYPDASDTTASNIISLLEVPGEIQVMLKVRIAELKRSASRTLGTNWSLTNPNFRLSNNSGGAGANIGLTILGTTTVNLALRAIETNGYGKILAEPNLVVLNGNTASFISGGEFAVPTAVGVGGIGAVATAFRGFGTQLSFTPMVIDKDRVRMNVIPTFSTPTVANTVNGIPGLESRSVQTTVEMREGQWLAIAGLIADDQSGSITGVPILRNIPIVKLLFSDKGTSRQETELLVLVSPEWVHPLEPEEKPALIPGMDITEPDDWDFYIRGRIEGRPHCYHRSTVWYTWQHLVKDARWNRDYHTSEGHYINGTHGFSE
ncbi:MAG: pilus assembly protein N-terminal domain-containing protein [Pirellulales bacterium]|nr:pilus assembly protein N-terminal domain-containing protein [Pirellulales bacterium]